MEAFLQSPSSPLVQINGTPSETAAPEDRHPARQSPVSSAPPPYEPSPPVDTDSRYRKENIVRVNPKILAEQSKRISKVALDHYNKRKKIKFELLDAQPVNFVPTKRRPYIHINFVARSSKEGSQEQLFFAELYLCGKRQTPSGYSVVLCQPLVHNSTTPGLVDMDKPTGHSPVRKNIDFTYCYACGPNMLHPKGGNYVGGHCNVPGIYKGAAML